MRSILAVTILFLLFTIDSVFPQPIPPSPKTPSSQQQDQTETAEETETAEKTLDFSDTGRPGQQTAGESRRGCNNLHHPLQALVPISHSGKTISAHPSFWVYFPYNNKQVDRIEFIVQNEDREDIWRSQSQINTLTGYQSFSLPETTEPLKIGEWYRWYVKVYCGSQTASSQYVQGWVKRVPLSSELYIKLQDNPQLSHQAHGVNGIWYDAIDSLLDLHHLQPSNISWEKDWQNLLQAKGVRLNNLPYIGATLEAIKH